MQLRVAIRSKEERQVYSLQRALNSKADGALTITKSGNSPTAKIRPKESAQLE